MDAQTAIPILLKLTRKGSAAAMLLGCRGVPHAVPDSARDVPDLDWSTCPICLARTVLQPLREVVRLSRVAPLSGWPDRYAVWALSGILQISEGAA